MCLYIVNDSGFIKVDQRDSIQTPVSKGRYVFQFPHG